MSERAFSLSSLNLPDLGIAESDLARRLALATEREMDAVRRPDIWRLLGELDWFVEPVRRPFRSLDVPISDNPSIVLVLPGFATRPQKMRYLSRNLERAGHKAKRWGLGFNWGVDKSAFAKLEDRLQSVNARYDQRVVLLGWSLGGLYARELAKRQPLCVSKVITMGTPFSGSPRANNVWRLYQMIAGHSVDEPPIEADLSSKPPVETVALWSPNDGAISPRSAAGFSHERDRAVALRCTHAGFTYTPEAIHAVLDELNRTGGG